ncbi:hypothetical protein [Dyella japonica]|uniref:Uncharacterized protein n=1 Tax=Dyella japonica TaxID=231455 RepID=A0ABV2K0V2_9GAMM
MGEPAVMPACEPAASAPTGLSRAHEAALYEASRRVSSWAVMWLECGWIKDECRRDVLAWLEAIPEPWWRRFRIDDAKERPARRRPSRA